MPRLYHLNAALTQFATAYGNGQYFADKICPDIPVDKHEDSYHSRRLIDVLTPKGDVIGERAEPSELDYELSSTSYVCKDRGNKITVSDKERREADGVVDGIQRTKVALALNNLLLAREIRVADFYNTNTNFASSNRISATANWSDTSSGDPVKDMHSAIAAIMPGSDTETRLVCVMALELWQEAQRHPKLQGLTSANDSGLISQDAFRAFFGLDEFYVSNAMKNTASHGATASYARIWDTDKVAVVRLPKSIPSVESAIFGGRFVVQQGTTAQAVISGQPMQNVVVTEWEEPGKGGGQGLLCNKVTVAESDPGAIQNDMGSCITGC